MVASGRFSGDGRYRIDLHTGVSGTDAGGWVYGIKEAGDGFWTFTPQAVRIRVSGVDRTGTYTYDYRGATPKTIGPILDHWRTVGYGTFLIEAWVDMDSGIGQAYAAERVTINNPATRPDTPYGLRASNVSINSFGVNYSRGGANGSPILQDQAEWSLSSGEVVWNDYGPAGYTSPNGGQTPGAPALTPDTFYRVRVRSRNALGWSNWSAYVGQRTLAATAPGLVVAPDTSGMGATLTLTPPSGISGVNRYDVEYRRAGTTTVTATTSETNTKRIESLRPGVSYEFRARAVIGSYQSPWTGWLLVIQPNPNTNPGDYFDGSTPARGDISFAWVGTPHASRSEARGSGVDGWSVTSASGTSTVLQRITGGFVGTYAARAIVVGDAVSAGLQVGMAGFAGKRAEVQPGSLYVGQIHVRPSRPQRVAATITWLNAAGALIAGPEGEAEVAPGGAQWTRLVASGVAPANAAFAIIRATDVEGEGWSLWAGGEHIDADGAMVTLGSLFSYFDGNTRDSREYRYDWTGAANASTSSRTTLPQDVYDPIADPDMPPLPKPPAPPSIPQEGIIEVGQWRRYALQIPATEVPQWGATIPTLVLRTEAFAERQVRIRYYANPDNVAPEQIDMSTWESEQIISYIPPYTLMTLDGVRETVTAIVSGAESVTANHLLYGTGGTPASWSEMTCGVAYVITLDVPLEAPAGNLTSRVLVTQRM